MKAPFRLDEEHTENDLLSALMHFASSASPVVIPRLKLHAIGPFFALVPEEPVAELNQLANDVVVAFDRFRAPLTGRKLQSGDRSVSARHSATISNAGAILMFSTSSAFI